MDAAKKKEEPAKPPTDQKKDDKAPAEETLNEEDQMLKEKLELLVERLSDKDQAQREFGLAEISKEIKGATSSMTSVPKPLKFLSVMYKDIVKCYEATPAGEFKNQLAELCSIVGMVSSEDNEPDALKYCLLGTGKNLVGWGHEYLRCLAGQIGAQYQVRMEKSEPVDDIERLVDQIIPEFINHNEQAEAVDLMIECEGLSKLIKFCNKNNFDRVCAYLLACSQYAADTEEMMLILNTAYEIYKSFKRYTDALRVA